jgi:cysteine-rich repeat protein
LEELITIYETDSDRDTTLSAEESLPIEETNIQIPYPEASAPDTEIGSQVITTGSLLEGGEEDIIPQDELIENQTWAIEEDSTTKEFLETIYEKDGILSGDTITSYTEKMTVLSKEQLTVLIPENTQIRTAQGEHIDIPQLELNLDTKKPHNETPTEQVIAPAKNEFVNQARVASSISQLPEENTLLEETSNLEENTNAEELAEENTVPTAPDVQVPSTTEKEPLEEIFEFGLPGEHLIFSEPVEISYYVPFHEGSLVEIQVQHAGDTQPGSEGLAIDSSSSCLPDGSTTKGGNLTEVIGGKVTFRTCGASTFSVIYTWWASAPNFVDNGNKNYTWLVLTWVNFPTWAILADVDILINFRPIDNESPTWPWWTTNCYPAEKSFILIHPDGTQVQLANAWTYTTPTTNCPQAQILYDQSAASGIVWWARALTGVSRQPIGNLSTLNGKSPFGTRTLRMLDNTSADWIILFWYDLILKNIECGDGIISTGEICDDGNIDNADWCTSICTVEAWRECTGQPSTCTEIPAPSGLRLHYNGSMTWALFQDIAWSGFHGTNFNSVTTGNQNWETVMCFNGTTQYIERATNLVTAYPFTMSTWMKSDTTTWLHGVVSFARSTSTNIMRNIEHNGTTIRSNGQNTTARYANATTALNTTEWFLVTAVYNSATDRDIYVNGVYEWTSTNNVGYSSNANNRLNIWRLADSSPTNYYDGCVDDVRFYSTALTSGQVYSLYAQPAALTTSYTTQASPLLTGTIDGLLDTITLTISGSIYTGTNNGNGTWTLTWGIISPWLANWSYPTILTVTNPYGRSVTYNSSFIVDACGNSTIDSGETCDDGNMADGDGCDATCTLEPWYQCSWSPSICDALTCSSHIYFDLDSSWGQSSGDTLFTWWTGLASRTGYFDIGSGHTGQIVIDFAWYDDGTTIDINGTHIYDEGQPNFFAPAITAPRTVNSNWLPRLRVTLTNGSVLIQGTLTATSTTLTTLTPTAWSTPPVFYAWAQNEIFLGVTNQAWASGSSFTVSYTNSCTPPVAGDYCIASPSSLDFPQFTTEWYAQTWYASSSWYFELIDSNGADNGYYTTLQVTNLSGTFTTITNSNLARQSSGITLLSWTANSNVVLGSAFSSYSASTWTVTFIKRDTAANSWITWTYGAILDLRISLPAYVRPDTYEGTITYTLYEN